MNKANNMAMGSDILGVITETISTLAGNENLVKAICEIYGEIKNDSGNNCQEQPVL